MYKEIRNYCLQHRATLVVVSKTQSLEKIESIYNEGQRVFGENRVQELTTKFEVLPKDIDWHLIGHLQKNKVKYIAPFIGMIHSVDSWQLIDTINKEATKCNRKIRILLQFHIAQESSKYGLSIEQGRELAQKITENHLNCIVICGVMGMATFTTDTKQIRKEFSQLKSIFDNLKKDFFPDSNQFCEISMGMSGDYKIAIDEGSTMIRVGSAIFS